MKLAEFLAEYLIKNEGRVGDIPYDTIRGEIQAGIEAFVKPKHATVIADDGKNREEYV